MVVILSTQSMLLGSLLLYKTPICSSDATANLVTMTLFYGPNCLLLCSLTTQSSGILQQIHQIPVLYGGGCLKVSMLFSHLQIVWGRYVWISLVLSCLLSRLYASRLMLIESGSCMWDMSPTLLHLYIVSVKNNYQQLLVLEASLCQICLCLVEMQNRYHFAVAALDWLEIYVPRYNRQMPSVSEVADVVGIFVHRAG